MLYLFLICSTREFVAITDKEEAMELLNKLIATNQRFEFKTKIPSGKIIRKGDL